ncbi:MAG TPA: L-seryl-tRNA(Sec) selenium transferase [Candidatus Cloacimonetes bacterium]|nr:L-seryl-tRNA(Sec) selenium transferase [Candidatus Cloacimonadota bacterium]HEX37318.1 L-seryl-tRNA(Sec) selenium transferase [Candidatus Cloacimonadota bacterium]
MNKKDLRNIPGVDILLKKEVFQSLQIEFGEELVKEAIRESIKELRSDILSGKKLPEEEVIIHQILSRVYSIGRQSLKKVVNATGIVLHTNLGRAPLGKKISQDVASIIEGYCNLEFDLKTAKRGHREYHITDLIRYTTGAEDAIVVNNNAAGVFLALHTFSLGKEALISRGELIEIGGSFRIPDIMKQSGAIMIEVGTTNRTQLADYKQAITENTAVVFKAHKSNYSIKGFSEEVETKELAHFAHENNLLCIFDMGSGLLRKPKGLPVKHEPDVRSALQSGADLVMFSCDKLLGGPQAGIIAGKKILIEQLRRSPLMRVLRVGKMTITALSSVLRSYLKDETLFNTIPGFRMLNQSDRIVKNRAEKFANLLNESSIKNTIIPSTAHTGGGSLPDLDIPSYAIQLDLEKEEITPEVLYHSLLMIDKPVLGILKEGEIIFDVYTLDNNDVKHCAESIIKIVTQD